MAPLSYKEMKRISEEVEVEVEKVEEIMLQIEKASRTR
jgi:hypothetical protein